MITLAVFAAAVLMLSAALAAAVHRNLLHAALLAVVGFAGVAAMFLLLGAEFVSFVQVLVYVGAIAVLLVFTILLTSREEGGLVLRGPAINPTGVLSGAAVMLGLVWVVWRTPELAKATPNNTSLTVKMVGEALMNNYSWPLLTVGLILTAALIGALVIVLEDKRR